jgi:hypothetical protein
LKEERFILTVGGNWNVTISAVNINGCGAPANKQLFFADLD